MPFGAFFLDKIEKNEKKEEKKIRSELYESRAAQGENESAF